MRGKARAPGMCDSGLDVLAPPPSSSLPFLPTLVTALALGGLGLLCRHPADVEAAPAVLPALVISADAGGVEPSAAPTAPVPGTVAFAKQFPLAADGQAVAIRPSRLAVNVRRGCPAGRCAEAKRPEPAARSLAQQRPADPSTTAAIPAFPREEDGQDTALPGEALPFMPTAAAMLDSVRSLGSRASTIGGSVIGSLAELN